MNREIKIKEYSKKYAQIKHHAWAGLGFISLLSAINYFFSIPKYVVIPLLIIFIIYSSISLILTYRYREGIAKDSIQLYKELQESQKSEKNKSKLEKKRIKNKIKAEKKSEKN